jgi:hypothetical protein
MFFLEYDDWGVRKIADWPENNKHREYKVTRGSVGNARTHRVFAFGYWQMPDVAVQRSAQRCRNRKVWEAIPFIVVTAK